MAMTYTVYCIHDDRENWVRSLRDGLTVAVVGLGDLADTVRVCDGFPAAAAIDADNPAMAVYLGSPQGAASAECGRQVSEALAAGLSVLPCIDRPPISRRILRRPAASAQRRGMAGRARPALSRPFRTGSTRPGGAPAAGLPEPPEKRCSRAGRAAARPANQEPVLAVRGSLRHRSRRRRPAANLCGARGNGLRGAGRVPRRSAFPVGTRGGSLRAPRVPGDADRQLS